MALLYHQKKSKFHRILETNDREGGRPLAWQRNLCPRKQALVESMNLACWQLAKKYTPRGYRNNPDHVADSYFQALVAVLRCAHAYDEKYGVNFCTYSYGSAQRQIWSYWKQRRESYAVRENINTLNFFDGREEQSSPIDCIFEDERAQDALREAECRADVQETLRLYRILKTIKPKWALVLAMRLGFDGHESQTLAQCADKLGCARQFVSQIYYKAINWIKKAHEQEKKAKEADRKAGIKDLEEFHRRNRITWRRMVSALPELQEVEAERPVLEVFDG